MSRVLKRPMFKLGGSTGEGITSGLSRKGYHQGGSDRPIRTRTTAEEILQGYGQAPRGYNVYDFLTEWGLKMASSPPMGNVIQTAAGTALEPYSKMIEGKGKAAQLEYAMRAQAHDAARAQNLATDKMSLQEKLHEQELASKERLALIASEGDDYFRKLVARPEMIIETAKAYSQGTNELGKSHSKGMALYDSSETYDTEQHKKGNIIKPTVGSNPDNHYMIYDKDTKQYQVNEKYFKQGRDEFNIFFDPVGENWFTVTFDDNGVVQIDQEKSMITGDVEENYRDNSLIELQTYIENKREVLENETFLNLQEAAKANILSAKPIEKIEEIKSEVVIHPTSDGTAKGTISDEYLQEYAEKNKIVFNMDDFKKKGADYAGYKLMTKTELRNLLRGHNIQQTKMSENEKKKEKSRRRKAFIWFNMNLEKFEAGILTKIPKSYEPYVDEYKKLDKKERLKIVRNE